MTFGSCFLKHTYAIPVLHRSTLKQTQKASHTEGVLGILFSCFHRLNSLLGRLRAPQISSQRLWGSLPKVGFLAFGCPGHQRADRDAFSLQGFGPALPLYGQKINGCLNNSAPRPHLFFRSGQVQSAQRWPGHDGHSLDVPCPDPSVHLRSLR